MKDKDTELGMEVKERYCSYDVAKLLKEKGFDVLTEK